MDWVKFIVELFATAAGGLIGGTWGAYLKSYSTEKGKNLATYQDIEFLLAQERGKAYEQEKGKRLATHEDIENVLREVQAVTRETETIKAQISADFWNRQTIWNQRRDLYAQTFEAIVDYRNLLSRIDRELETPRWKEEFQAMLARFKRLLALAHIFLGPKGSEAFEDFYGSTIQMESFEGNGGRIHTFEIALIKAARKDLGVN